ncbi:MAG: right-handed parallel beta-helix repeat-containing protein, partial [Candidatus Thorarchaeota archaeon]
YIPPPPTPLQLTPHDSIAIDGDANFAAIALQEGWPGDGSPENPYIIDGLDIDLGGGFGSCIAISNTRVNFTISNCNLTGTGPDFLGWSTGIYLENVTNGELVNNNCNTIHVGVLLIDSHSNTVFNNICYNNSYGIDLGNSDHNTVFNNTCNGNIVIFGDETPPYSGWGISLRGNSNIVANNSCFSNEVGIILWGSHSNAVVNNTCSNNRIGVYIDVLDFLDSNTVESNVFLGNTEHDIYIQFDPIDPIVFLPIGFAGIIMLGAAWRMVSLKRSLKPQGIKKSLNLNLKPRIIFVAMSLIIILTTGLTYILILPEGPLGFWERLGFNPAVPLLISFAEIIMLGAAWRMVKLSRFVPKEE